VKDLLDLVERHPYTAVWLIGVGYVLSLMMLLGVHW
jgi:hypothetical protein